MAKMWVDPRRNHYLQHWLVERGHKEALAGFEVDEQQFLGLVNESCKLHPTYPIEKHEAWAGYSCYTLGKSPKPEARAEFKPSAEQLPVVHQFKLLREMVEGARKDLMNHLGPINLSLASILNRLPEKKDWLQPPKEGTPVQVVQQVTKMGLKERIALWGWRALLLAALLFLLFGQAKGQGVPHSPLVVDLEDATVSQAIRAGGLIRLNCGANLTCVWDTANNRFTMDAGVGGSVAWDGITAPGGNQALAMAAWMSTWTWNAATGANNLFTGTDTASNTGTGYLFNWITATGSTLKPFRICYRGTTDCITLDTTTFQAVGSATIVADSGWPVDSVFTRTGAVVATEGDYSLTLLSDVTAISGTGSTVALATFTALGTNDFPQWSGTNWVNASPDAGTDLTADLEEEAHASEHQNAGGDEVATATAGANLIPKANASADLDPAWIITGTVTFNRCVRVDGSGNIAVHTGDCGGGANVDLLDGSVHQDTLVGTVVLGDIIHGNVTPAWARLAGNITTTKMYLTQTGSGAVSAVPVWAQGDFGDLSGSATLAQLPFGAANQVLGTNAGASAIEHKTLATGTAGTDFAILHGAGLVTFNLPVASTTNTGKLSNTDWDTFTAKEDEAHGGEHDPAAADPLNYFGSTPGTDVVTTNLVADPTNNNCVVWLTNGVLGDNGSACAGGSTRWDQLADPTAAINLNSNANTELFQMNFTSALGATDVAVQIEQLTGNPVAGSILLELVAADLDILLLSAGSGANTIDITQAGAMTAQGTASITATLGDNAASFFAAGELEITRGGTGQASANAAMNALSPVTTEGDIIFRNATVNARLARGANGECLTSNTTTILWGSCGGGGGSWNSLTDPTAVTIFNSGAIAELFQMNFTANYGATDVLVDLEQLTGNPLAGSILLGLTAADPDILLLSADGFTIDSVGAAAGPSFTGTGSNGFISFPDSAAAVSDANEGNLRYESATQRLRASFNTAAYSDIALASDNLSLFSSTTSAQLLALLSDPTGTGVAVFSAPTAFTLDVETGTNAITTVSKIYIDAASCIGATATNNWSDAGTGDTAPTAACNDTGSIQRPSADFAGGAVNSMELTMRLPSDWASGGAVDVSIRYVITAATPTGNVEFDVSTICRAPGETWDAAFNAAQTITEGVAAQNTIDDADQASVTMTTCAADEDWTLKISRDGTNDTNNDTAKVLGVMVTLRRTQ